MSTADSILRRVALVLSIVLVLLLASIAAISVFGADDGPEAAEGEASPLDDEDAEDPASATALYPATDVQVQSNGSDLAVSCAPEIGNSTEYRVSVENFGDTSQSFLVAVDLVDDDGNRVEAMAEVEDLQPAEERAIPLVLRSEISSVAECLITAIQGDRQITLTGR